MEGEKRLNKADAINEAILLQNALYEHKSPHLRDYKAFSPEHYNQAENAIENFKELEEKIEKMPTEHSERLKFIFELLEEYPLKVVVIAWQNIIFKDFSKGHTDLEKFSSYSSPIFGESDKEYGKTKSSDPELSFNYGSAANFYMVLAHQIYKEISGLPYMSPQELKYNFENALKGKKILELAPGPGWFIKVLNGMGADVVGLDKDFNETFKKSGVTSQLGKGDAKDLEWIFGHDKFDLIISNNFLNIVTLEKAEAKEIITQTIKTLKAGGRAIHATQLFIYPTEFMLLKRILKDPENIDKYIETLLDPDHNQTYTANDLPVVNYKDAQESGGKNIHEGNEGGYYYVSYSK